MSEPLPAGRAVPGDDGTDRTPLDVVPAAGGTVRDSSGAADSPLRGVDYPLPAECLWRWVDASADTVTGKFVTGYARLDAANRRTLRSGLCPDDLYTLLTFARRRAFAAIRSGHPVEVRAAFDAVSAIELHRIDWRDVWVAAALTSYAAERLGLAPADAVREAAERAEPELAALLAEVTRDSIDLAEECGYRVLETPTGRVLVDDEGGAYAPAADLAGLAFETAAILERDGYQVGQVTVAAELPATWLAGSGEPDVRAALRGLTGCASLLAEPSGAGAAADQHLLLAYLAEAATGQDAARLGDAATRYPARDAVGLGVAVGRHCALVVARSTVLGVPPIEDRASLARFGPPLEAILSGVSTPQPR